MKFPRGKEQAKGFPHSHGVLPVRRDDVRTMEQRRPESLSGGKAKNPQMKWNEMFA